LVLISVKTRYETRTRIIDAQGNELYEGPVRGNYAPPHPDVDGPNSETGGSGVPRSEPPEQPVVVEAGTDAEKEKSAEEEQKKPKPASEGNEATAV
jgi:dolichyl-phosphate-mannose-protein mannosyltransferase